MPIIDGYLRRSESIDDLLDQVVTVHPLFLREDRDILRVKQLKSSQQQGLHTVNRRRYLD